MDYVREIDLSVLQRDRTDVREFAGPSSGVGSCVFRYQRIPAGVQTGGNLHIHTVHQFYWIVSGTMTVTLGSEELEAGPNSVVIMPPGVPHRARNLGREDCVHLEIIVPAPDPAGTWLMRVEPKPSQMDLVRTIDLSALRPDRRDVKEFVGPSSGVDTCILRYQCIPAGEDAQGGQHVHAVHQFYWIISGTMTATLYSNQYTAGPNSLVILPPGVPHSAANLGSEDCVHLEVLAPAPEPGLFASRVMGGF